MARNKRFPYWIGIGIVLLVGIASWAIYSVLNQGLADLLLNIGIENFYIQNLLIIGSIFIILILLGFTFKKTLNKLIK